MLGKRFTAEKIINMLREAEVLLSTGKTAGEVCRELDISEQTYYRWRKEQGGMYIEPGSPRENSYIGSFNGKLRDEVLSREVFDTLLEAKVLVDRWLWEYNHIRPHSSLGYRPPAPEAIIPMGAQVQETLSKSYKVWGLVNGPHKCKALANCTACRWA